MDLIYSMPLKGEGHVKLCWKSAESKGFKVRECYFSLSLTPGILFLWKPVWRSKILPRVAFFSWTASLGKFLTIDNLWNRGVTIVDWYFMCKGVGSMWIIFFFIVPLLLSYGQGCEICLVFYGLCHIVSLIYTQLGKVHLANIET